MITDQTIVGIRGPQKECKTNFGGVGLLVSR